MIDETYQDNQGSSDARNDPKSNRITDLESRVPHLLDKRKTVEYTFTGTGEESFLHELGKVPNGAMVVSQSKAGTIHMDTTKWTKQRLHVTSSIAGNKVTFLLF